MLLQGCSSRPRGWDRDQTSYAHTCAPTVAAVISAHTRTHMACTMPHQKFSAHHSKHLRCMSCHRMAQLHMQQFVWLILYTTIPWTSACSQAQGGLCDVLDKRGYGVVLHVCTLSNHENPETPHAPAATR